MRPKPESSGMGVKLSLLCAASGEGAAGNCQQYNPGTAFQYLPTASQTGYTPSAIRSHGRGAGAGSGVLAAPLQL